MVPRDEIVVLWRCFRENTALARTPPASCTKTTKDRLCADIWHWVVVRRTDGGRTGVVVNAAILAEKAIASAHSQDVDVILGS